MILILTYEGDEHADAVCTHLELKNASFCRLNTADIPQRVRANLAYGFQQDLRQISIDGVDLDLRSVTAVWYRRAFPPIPHEYLNSMDQHFVKVESLHLLGSLYQLLDHAFWVNHLGRHAEASHKPYQLSVAQKVGLAIPRTLITNDSRLVTDFFAACGEEMIYKSLTSHARIVDDAGRALFTTQLTLEDVHTHLEQVNIGPCVFQQALTKAVELRVTVIGSRIFAVELDSQSNEFSRIDWRKPSPTDPEAVVPVRRVDLSSEVQEKILDYMSALGLVFGCLDFIVQPSGKLVFLEINPGGQWLGFAERTDSPMASHLAEMLIQRTPTYQI